MGKFTFPDIKLNRMLNPMSQDSCSNTQNSWLYNYQYNEGKIIRNSDYGTDSIIIVNNNVQLRKESLVIL